MSETHSFGAQQVEWRPAAPANNRGRIPFIRTPRSNNIRTVDIDVEFSGNVRTLDFFNYGDDDNAAFMQRWTSSQNRYALLQNNVITMMLDWDDRELNYGSGGVNHRQLVLNSRINDLLKYYENLTAQFNRFHGLDINSQNPHHRLIHTRFLIAPQLNGFGYAFYGADDVTGMNGSRIGSYLNFPAMVPLTTQAISGLSFWVSLHEIGHGYDGNFSGGKEVGLGEIANNILSHFYQANHFDFTSANDRRWSWLFDYGNAAATSSALDARAITRRTGNLSNFAAEPNRFRDNLFILVNMYANGSPMTDIETPQKIYAAAQRLNREMHVQGQNWSLANLNAKAFSDAANTNIVPYMEAFGFGPHLSDLMRAYAFEEDNKIGYFLDRIAGSEAQRIATAEVLYGTISPVVPNAARGLNGTGGTITINISDIDLIKGETLRIMNGADVVFQAEITSNTVNFPALAIGAYFVKLPSAKAGFFHTGHHHLVVRNGQRTDLTVEYRELTASPLLGTTQLLFRGGSARTVATITYDPVARELVVNAAGGAPHWVNSGTYIQAEIWAGGQRAWNHTWTWQGNVAGFTRRIPVAIGDSVRFTHAEAFWGGRADHARVINSFTAEWLPEFEWQNHQWGSLVVTQYGLAKPNSSVADQRRIYTANFFSALETTKQAMPAQSWTNPSRFRDVKTSFILGADLLSEADRNRFIAENPHLFGGGDGGNPNRISSATRARAISFAVSGITTAGNLNLTIPQAGNYKISIYNVNGRILAQSQANIASGANGLSLNRTIAKGVAIVRVEGANVQAVRRVMVR